MTTNSEREAFERWANRISEHSIITTLEDDVYVHRDARIAWAAWQAARSTPSPRSVEGEAVRKAYALDAALAAGRITQELYDESMALAAQFATANHSENSLDMVANSAPAAVDGAPELVPGVVRCAKCKFQLVRTNLYLNSGTTGPGDSKTEPCPNGCGPLWQVTMKQWAEEGWARAEEYFFELKSLRESTANSAEGKVVDESKPIKATKVTPDIRRIAAARGLLASESHYPLLASMATNYKNGHEWDALDTDACISASDEIKALRRTLEEMLNATASTSRGS